MKQEGLLTLVGRICVALILGVLLLVGACAKPAPTPAPAPAPAPAPKPAPAPAPAPAPKPVVLEAVIFVPVNASTGRSFVKWADAVNEAAKGELIIKIRGGPEVIAPFDQGMAVKEGTVDMALLPGAFYDPLVPDMHALSKIKPWEERENGAYDIVAEEHKKAGLFYLGRGNPHPLGVHVICTNKRVEKPQELAGQKMAVRGIMLEFMKELGIVPVTTSEFYTAVERGVVDGFSLNMCAIPDRQLQEVTKYCIDHRVFGANLVVIINMDTWNAIPKRLQDLLIEVDRKLEREILADNEKLYVEARQKMQDGGMEFIKFSPADAKWFDETAYRVEWAKMMKRAPELAAKLRPLYTK